MHRISTYLTAAALLIAVSAFGQDKEDSRLCHLRVDTEPEGALVSLDGGEPSPAPFLGSGIEPGEHLIVVTKEGYKSDRQTIKLLEQQKISITVKLKSLTGLLLVHTTPEGVEVKLDDADQGKTPLLLTDIDYNQYKLTLSKPGYLPKTINVNIENRMPKLIKSELTPNSGTLVLDSEPRGASIIINGVSKGKTPITIDSIPGGSSVLELKYEGYKEYKKSFKLTAGQKEELKAVLEPIASQLSIFSIPGKARIYVNNQFRGEAPIELKDLKPGSYRIRAELTGYESTARTIELKRATSIREELRLDGNCGQLQVTTEPAGVQVFVDGHQKGITTSKEDETDLVSQPLLINLIPEGQHEIKLTNKKFFPMTFKVQIMKGKTTTLHPKKMERRFIPDWEVRTKNGVHEGILVQILPNGDIKLEVKPGIIKTIAADQIRSRKPIKKADLGKQP